MFFTIDPENGLAIYDQILRQVEATGDPCLRRKYGKGL